MTAAVTPVFLFCSDRLPLEGKPFLAEAFFERWIASSRIKYLAGLSHLSISTFLILIEIILGLVSIHVIDCLIGFADTTVRKSSIVTRAKNYETVQISQIVLIIVVCIMQLVQIQYSALESISMIFQLRVGYA